MKTTLNKINQIDQLMLLVTNAQAHGKITGLLATTQLDLLDMAEAVKPHIEKLKVLRADLLKKHGSKVVQSAIPGTTLVRETLEFIAADETAEHKINEAMDRAKAYNEEYTDLLNAEREINLPTFTRAHFVGASGDYFLDFFRDLKTLGLLV